PAGRGTRRGHLPRPHPGHPGGRADPRRGRGDPHRPPGAAGGRAMTWTLVLVLAAGAYGFKALGLVVLGDRPLPARLERCLALIPAALSAALVVGNTFADGQDLTIDPRAAGVGVAVIAAWRRANLVVVIVLAAVVTALVRAVT